MYGTATGLRLSYDKSIQFSAPSGEHYVLSNKYGYMQIFTYQLEGDSPEDIELWGRPKVLTGSQSKNFLFIATEYKKIRSLQIHLKDSAMTVVRHQEGGFLDFDFV
jgi:hypothetical protein